MVAVRGASSDAPVPNHRATTCVRPPPSI